MVNTQHTAQLASDELEVLLPAWTRSLRAARRSPKTIKNYLDAGEQLLAFLPRGRHADHRQRHPPRARRVLSRRPRRDAQRQHRRDTLPRPAAALPLARGGGRDQRQPDDPHAPADGARVPGARAQRRRPDPAAEDVCRAHVRGTSRPGDPAAAARHRHAPRRGDRPHHRRHRLEQRRCLRRRQGRTATRLSVRSADRPGPRPVPASASATTHGRSATKSCGWGRRDR